MALNIGRKGRLYVVQEAGTLGGNGAGYGQSQTGASGSNTLSAAARAMRHTDFKAVFDPYNRVNSNEKKTSPGRVVDLDRRRTAALSNVAGLLRPSGTVGTRPECDPILLAALGTSTLAALSTTVNDAAATTTSCTFTAVTGLTIGDAIALVAGGKTYVRFVTNIASLVVSWAPALPVAPSNSSAVKSGVTYKLTTGLALSLAFLHCLDGFRRELRGAAVDKFAIALDANAEPSFTASGPASDQVSDAAAVADPGTFTQIGGNPPSGLVGETYIGATAYLIKKAGLSISNGLVVRNEEYGANADAGIASEVVRATRRDVALTLEAYTETAATLYDLTKAGTRSSFFNQTGRTLGNIVAVYCPNVYWHPADTDNPETAVSWAFKGEARESADGQNDEVFLGLV